MTGRGQGIYSFSHLTFQEHLAARAAADRDDYIAYTLNRLADSWWREVVLLEAGYLSTQGQKRATALIRAIMDYKPAPAPYHNLVIAADCLRDVGQARITGDLWQQVKSRLKAAFELPLRKTGVIQAAENGEIDKLKALDVKNNVEKAVVTAEMPEATKTGIIEYINSVKGLLEGVVSAGGLVTAFTKAVEAAWIRR